MGSQFQAKCKSCGHEFTAEDGGGFFFHLLHCDKCGRAKDISFRQLGEIHLRYLKGLPNGYCSASAEHDRIVRETYLGEPLSEDNYHEAVESIAGHCRCRGKYTFDASPRCPKCRSLDLEEGEATLMYD